MIFGSEVTVTHLVQHKPAVIVTEGFVQPKVMAEVVDRFLHRSRSRLMLMADLTLPKMTPEVIDGFYTAQSEG